MDKKQASYYLRRIYRLIESGKINIALKKLGAKVDGITYFAENPPKNATEIHLKPDCSILLIFVHECVHVLYPDMSENNVISLSQKIFAELSLRQVKNLLVRLAQVIKTQHGYY